MDWGRELVFHAPVHKRWKKVFLEDRRRALVSTGSHSKQRVHKITPPARNRSYSRRATVVVNLPLKTMVNIARGGLQSTPIVSHGCTEFLAHIQAQQMRSTSDDRKGKAMRFQALSAIYFNVKCLLVQQLQGTGCRLVVPRRLLCHL